MRSESLIQKRNALHRGRSFYGSQERSNVGQVFVRQGVDGVGRHDARGLAYVLNSRRGRPRRDSRPGAATLPLITVALITAIFRKQPLAALRVTTFLRHGGNTRDGGRC